MVRRGHPLAKARTLAALVDQDWMTAAIVAGTNFIATIPKLLLEIGLARDLVEIVKVRETLAVSNVCLFTKRDSPLTPAAALLAKFIRDAARHASAASGSGR